MLVPDPGRSRVAPGSAILLGALLAYSCSSEGEGRPDKDLGNLVLAPVQEAASVDLDKASEGHEALFDALHLPHTWVSEQIGAHTVEGQSKVVVKEAGVVLEELEDTLLLDMDGEDRFLATLDNSKDYGRHAIYDGDSLYLRPRFGKYHARAPQSDEEANEIRNEMFAGATDYLDLFVTQVEVSDKGKQTLAGRAVRQVSLKLAPKARAHSLPAKLSQHRWRDTIEVQAIEGVVSLDAESGIVIALAFEGSIKYTRDKRRFEMLLQATRTISNIGHERAIAPPEQDLILRIPARRKELAERDSLLQGIAPPARKAPTPKAPTEANPKRSE